MEASLHLTGDPKSGTLVELQVIAAVVVGGTSLAGGQGKIFGTLIGALIIGVIRNGMNLTGVEAHMQQQRQTRPTRSNNRRLRTAGAAARARQVQQAGAAPCTSSTAAWRAARRWTLQDVARTQEARPERGRTGMSMAKSSSAKPSPSSSTVACPKRTDMSCPSALRQCAPRAPRVDGFAPQVGVRVVACGAR